MYILTERLQINGVENCTEQKGTERTVRSFERFLKLLHISPTDLLISKQ